MTTETLHPEWTAQRRAILKRNQAIQGRNRFMANFNEWFGTDHPPIALEALPAIGAANHDPGPIGTSD